MEFKGAKDKRHQASYHCNSKQFLESVGDDDDDNDDDDNVGDNGGLMLL